MRAIRRLAAKVFLVMGYRIQRATITQKPEHFLTLDPAYGDFIKRVRPFTSTSCERIAALMDATRYVVRAGIPGAIVECGVWRGGSIMATALTLLQEGELRDLYLFDTFAGMTPPTECDVDYRGESAQELYAQLQNEAAGGWSYVSLEDVRRNVLSTGYPEERIHCIKGDVLQTIPHASLGEIAILRLDTDWYESTLHELKQLYPLLRPGGILIIDDFGFWQGCRKAVEEYFGPAAPFLSIIDHDARLLVKPGSGLDSRPAQSANMSLKAEIL